MPTIGIDALALAVPEGYLDLADLAAARGVPAGKFVDGLGVIAHGGGAPARRSGGAGGDAARRVLSSAEIDPSTIGLCVVGTETAVDHSKPVAAYLHRLLGLPQHCRVFEAKHACFGGTAGLLAALDWIAAGSARGRKALIICTDIARYGLSTPGEPTQGAGAVAMVVSENPRLLELEVGVTGSYAQDVNDFWRPLVLARKRSSTGITRCSAISTRWPAPTRAGSSESRGGGRRRAAGASLLSRALRQDGQEGASPRHAARGQDEAEADDVSYAHGGRAVAAPAVAGRQHLHRARSIWRWRRCSRRRRASSRASASGLFSYGSGCCAEFFAGRVVAGAGAFAEQAAAGGADEGSPSLHVRRVRADPPARR